MAFEVDTAFLTEFKRHIRVFHDSDDDLIKNEVEVAVLNIWTQYLLKAEADLPATASALDARVKLAVKHLATSFRQNPDDHMESKYIVYNKDLIQNILGSQMAYFKEL